MENELLSGERIREKAYNAFEEEPQEAKDFLEANIDKIVAEMIRLEVTEEDFLDLFQQEIEKYEEYLDLE